MTHPVYIIIERGSALRIIGAPQETSCRIIDLDDLKRSSSGTRVALAQLVLALSSPLLREVACFVLHRFEDDEGTEAFFRGLPALRSADGVWSGNLMPVREARRFYERHETEIDSLRLVADDPAYELPDSLLDLRSSLAWFGFEQAARQLAAELDLDLSS